MRRSVATAAVMVAVAVLGPHVLDYLSPITYGLAAWAYAAHPRGRWILERRT